MLTCSLTATSSLWELRVTAAQWCSSSRVFGGREASCIHDTTIQFIRKCGADVCKVARTLTRRSPASPLDGNIITVGALRFRCLEVCSRPNFVGNKARDIHYMTVLSVMTCDVNVRKISFRRR